MSPVSTPTVSFNQLSLQSGQFTQLASPVIQPVLHQEQDFGFLVPAEKLSVFVQLM